MILLLDHNSSTISVLIAPIVFNLFRKYKKDIFFVFWGTGCMTKSHQDKSLLIHQIKQKQLKKRFRLQTFTII